MTPERVRALLGGAPLRALFQAVRDALESRGAQQARSVTLGGLSAPERQAIAGLHGWREVPEGDMWRKWLRVSDALTSWPP